MLFLKKLYKRNNQSELKQWLFHDKKSVFEYAEMLRERLDLLKIELNILAKNMEVGEIRKIKEYKYKCVDSEILKNKNFPESYMPCFMCAFSGYECDIVGVYLGQCNSDDRKDNKNVVFVLLKGVE